MELIRTVMLNILVIVFLTTLLDLLLPEGTMRSYIKMTMGFFIVLTLLQPVMQLFAPNGSLQQWQLSIPTMVQNQAEELEVQGSAYEAQQKQIEALYQEKVEKQISSLLLLTTDWKEFQVTCVMQKQQIAQICIQIPQKEQEDYARVQQALSGYYGLDIRQIVIEVREDWSDGMEKDE